MAGNEADVVSSGILVASHSDGSHSVSPGRNIIYYVKAYFTKILNLFETCLKLIKAENLCKI